MADSIAEIKAVSTTRVSGWDQNSATGDRVMTPSGHADSTDCLLHKCEIELFLKDQGIATDVD